MRLILVAVALALGTLSPARAADDPVLAEAGDLPGFVMFHDSGAPGMVLVIERGGAIADALLRRDRKGQPSFAGRDTVCCA